MMNMMKIMMIWLIIQIIYYISRVCFSSSRSLLAFTGFSGATTMTRKLSDCLIKSDRLDQVSKLIIIIIMLSICH